MTSNAPRAILYLRLSAESEDSTSIARQRAELIEHGEREGWTVVRELADDGISGRKVRANAVEALRMLREGEADILAVWKLDRWTRQGLSAIGDLIGTLESSPGTVFFALKDGLRSDQAAFGIIAAVLSETAKSEADNAATRVRSAIAARKRAGRFTGGTPPFGYYSAPAEDGPGRVLRVDRTEAALLQSIAARVLDGESVARICAELHADGVPSSRSDYRRARTTGRPTEGLDRGVWWTTSLQQLLTSEHLLGRSQHHGATVLGDDGLPAQHWEPILSLAPFARLQEVVTNPRKPEPKPKRVRASALLSGVAYCADCGSKLYVHYTGRARLAYYRCPRPTQSCGGVGMLAANAERAVVESYLRVAGPFPELIEETTAEDNGTKAALGEIEAALQETTRALTSDEADVPALLGRLDLLKSRRAELRAAPVAELSSVWRPSGRTYAEAWDAAEDLDARRALLLKVLDHITVRRTDARRGYHPERISYFWHEHAGRD